VVVKLLLEKGADVESKDAESGRTPLSRATERGREAVVKLLLKKGLMCNRQIWSHLRDTSSLCTCVTIRRPLGLAVRPWHLAHMALSFRTLTVLPLPLFFRFVVLV
jgi:Ankyrin repeats (many copies)